MSDTVVDPSPASVPDAGDDDLVIEHLSKTFPGQRALNDVSFRVRPGEVHALLGHNGSGKSTLIKVLAGYHAPDPGGSVTVAGEALTFAAPQESLRTGLRFVHQSLGLVGRFIEDMWNRPARADELALVQAGFEAQRIREVQG